jgi:hypothetical protein
MDITWLSHKLLGDKYVKSAVFELLKRDPDSSAVNHLYHRSAYFIFVYGHSYHRPGLKL